mmetsp:Transcript_34333/g.113624  ORF Transcript_34333/g.113624 Transcript_34333/m.113624 type:complete len:314 (+) Transcript_34333:35-976(+)
MPAAICTLQAKRAPTDRGPAANEGRGSAAPLPAGRQRPEASQSTLARLECGHRVRAALAARLEALPEDGARVQHLVRRLPEADLVRDEPVLDGLLELVHGVRGVLRLERLVEAPEAHPKLLGPRRPLSVQLLESLDELVPEAGVGPVLDRKGGTERGGQVLAAVNAIQRIAKVQRRLRPVAPLAQLVKGQPHVLADVAEPLEVRSAVREDAALDGAGDRDDVRVEPFLGRLARQLGRLLLLRLEDHPNLVGQNLLALACALQRRRVDDLVQLGEEEEVGEDGELHNEILDLLFCRLALREPIAVGIVLDHRMR